MPPAHQAIAKRTPDRLRADAAALGPAIGAYVDRLRPFLDGGAEQSLGAHANLRGPAYYN